MYNSILRSFMQSYLLACISMWYYLLEKDFSSSEGIVNFCVALAILVVTVSFPIYAQCLLRKERDNLRDKTFKARYDSLYQKLDYYKRNSLVNTSLFLWRRLIFAFVIVFLSFCVVLQIFLIDVLSTLLLCFYLSVHPMWDGLNNAIQVINELVVLLCVWLMFHYTLYVEDA